MHSSVKHRRRFWGSTPRIRMPVLARDPGHDFSPPRPLRLSTEVGANITCCQCFGVIAVRSQMATFPALPRTSPSSPLTPRIQLTHSLQPQRLPSPIDSDVVYGTPLDYISSIYLTLAFRGSTPCVRTVDSLVFFFLPP